MNGKDSGQAMNRLEPNWFPPSPSAVNNVREESRRVLETFLRIQLQRTNEQDKLDDKNEAVVRDNFQEQASPMDRSLACERMNSDLLKSSQSTCSSVDGIRGRNEGDIDASQQTTSCAAAGSLSSSSSNAEENNLRKTSATDTRKKKSVIRRVKERIERTMSLRRRRAEEKAERSGKKQRSLALKNAALRKAKRRLTTANPENATAAFLCSKREDDASIQERRVRMKFSDMAVSSAPPGDDAVKRTAKRTRPRAVTVLRESKDAPNTAGSIFHNFLTPPDSGLRSSAKKRPRRDVAGARDQRRTTSSMLMTAVESATRTIRKQAGSCSPGCSPTRWLRRMKANVENRKEIGDGCRAKEGNGLELLTSTNCAAAPTGIVHRASGEFDQAIRKLSDSAQREDAAGTVEISIQPPTSSSSEPHSSLSPLWSAVCYRQPDGSEEHSQRLNETVRSTESSQEQHSSYDSLEEKYAIIAQRLSELGDSFLIRQWINLRTQTSEEDDREEPRLPAPTVSRLSSIEKDMVEFINACDKEMQGCGGCFQQDVVRQLAGSDDSQQFGCILNGITGRAVTEPMSWSALAVVFHLTTAAVRAVGGAGTNAARRLMDYCCDYVTLTFSGWIIGQGGWSSVVEDSEEERRGKQNRP